MKFEDGIKEMAVLNEWKSGYAAKRGITYAEAVKVLKDIDAHRRYVNGMIFKGKKEQNKMLEFHFSSYLAEHGLNDESYAEYVNLKRIAKDAVKTARKKSMLRRARECSAKKTNRTYGELILSIQKLHDWRNDPERKEVQYRKRLQMSRYYTWKKNKERLGCTFEEYVAGIEKKRQMFCVPV